MVKKINRFSPFPVDKLTFTVNQSILEMKKEIAETKINIVYHIIETKISLTAIKMKKKIMEMNISLIHEDELIFAVKIIQFIK